MPININISDKWPLKILLFYTYLSIKAQTPFTNTSKNLSATTTMVPAGSWLKAMAHMIWFIFPRDLETLVFIKTTEWRLDIWNTFLFQCLFMFNIVPAFTKMTADIQNGTTQLINL